MFFWVATLGILSGCAGNASTPKTFLEPSTGPRQDRTAALDCKLDYPVESRRNGEQGTVVVRAFVEPSGKATQAEVYQTSGFQRLDQAGLDYLGCLRFVPGRRNGVPVAMWFQVPLRFALNPAPESTAR